MSLQHGINILIGDMELSISFPQVQEYGNTTAIEELSNNKDSIYPHGQPSIDSRRIQHGVGMETDT